MTARTAMERRTWHGNLNAEQGPDLFKRIEAMFPLGSQVAISSVVGDWSHDLTVEQVSELRLAQPDHLIIVTTNYVRGIHENQYVKVEDDYRGRRLTVKGQNGVGEPLCWIFVGVDQVES